MSAMSKPDPRGSRGSTGNEAIDPKLLPGDFVLPTAVMQEEITAYEAALAAASNERAMQRFLQEHPQLLTQHLGASHGRWVIPQKRLGAEHVPDFLIAEIGSTGFVWYAVELKRPQAKLFTKKGDPSAALTHALRQISDWRDWLSYNRDYAMRPRDQSGVGLLEIDPELEGLIILGRDADIDPLTNASRRRLSRERKVRIETYDWLSRQNPLTETPLRRAAKEVFGNFESYMFEVATRAVQVECVTFSFDSEADDYDVPINFVCVDTGSLPVSLSDWMDWVKYADKDIGTCHSLLVSERPPDERLREALTEKLEGVWYAPQWYRRRKDLLRFKRVDALIYIPPASEQRERVARLSAARELLLHYLPDPDHVPDEKHVQPDPFQTGLFDEYLYGGRFRPS